MGNLGDFTIDQVAGALALILGSLGGLLMICFKSRCSQIRLCWGLWSCVRVIPPDNDDDESTQPTQTATRP